MNDALTTLRRRAEIFRAVRAFFESRDFVEIHTPLLVVNPGLEPHLVPFESRFEPGLGGGQPIDYFLPTSPEYHLKKALAMGFPKIFEITRSFRNGERSPEHEPEFFMLEWYRHPGDYREIADDFKALMTELGRAFAPTAPWANASDITVRDAFAKYCGLDLDAALRDADPLALTKQAVRAGFASVRADDDFDTCFHKLIVERIEPKLGFDGPTFLWDYPASLCALARIKPDAPLYCERFEAYWRGIELCNAFGELTDADEQRRRCVADQALRLRNFGKTPPLDEAFFDALRKLSHPAGGIAVGLDRLVQVLLAKTRIQDVIAFPYTPSYRE